MRVGMSLDWNNDATSLKNLAKNYFRELGLLMKTKKQFTIAGIRTENIGIGDVSHHYDLVHIPNMGGYKFPEIHNLSGDNLILSPSGIDEVILGREVFKTNKDWKINKPIIDSEVRKWKKYGHKVKAVHVVTNSEKEDMIKYLEIPAEKFHVIPHGVDHDTFKPPKNKDETRKKILSIFFIKDCPFFVHVSESNWARKNIFSLLEAFRNAKNLGLKQELILIGKNDPIVYKKAASIPGVKVLGFVDEKNLVDLFGAADAIILPSKHEGFGLPLLEAMACGTPSITSNVFSPPEVVGDSGLLVNPYDVQDITKKIIEMGNNENLRVNLAKKALERSKKFSWKESAEKIFELYKDLSPNQDEGGFDENIDLAGYRTLVTICEISPNLRNLTIQDLLEFDFSRIINWALEQGIIDSDMKDFLIPFKGWLKTKRDELQN